MDALEDLKKLLEALKASQDSMKEEMKASQETMKEDIKASQETVIEGMKASQESMIASQESMKEEMKASQESMKEEMKASQESMKEEMKASQETMKEDIRRDLKKAQDEMKAGQEEMKTEIASVKDTLQEKLSAVETKVYEIKENVEKEINSVEKTVSEIKEDFLKVKDKVDTIDNRIEQKILEKFENKIEENIEKKILEKFGNKIEEIDKQGKLKTMKEERTFEATTSRPSIKLATYDGKTSWKVFKAQFSIVAEANEWDDITKACQLAASLRGDAAGILETLPENQRLNFEALISALELRFGEECMKDFSRLHLKSRFQKAGESMQEFAADIERLSIAAYPDCPAAARESFALEYFIDGLRDHEIKKSLRMLDIRDMKSALVHALKCEAVQKASGARHNIRAATMDDQEAGLEKLKKDIIRELSREFRYTKDRRSSQNSQVKCWSCGQDGHLRRNCPSRKDGGDHLTPQEGNF